MAVSETAIRSCLIVLNALALTASLNYAGRGAPFISLGAEARSLRRMLVGVFLWRGWYVVAAFSAFISVETYGQGIDNPIPWSAAARCYRQDGTGGAILCSLYTAVADLWLLWMPANLFLARWRGEYQLWGRPRRGQPEWKPEVPWLFPEWKPMTTSQRDEWMPMDGVVPLGSFRFLYPEVSLRLLNIAVGLVLMTKGNPVFRVLKWFLDHSGAPSS